jgi:beta-phosphoglucomutase
MIQAIVFDAEGVVIDTEPIWDEEQTVFLTKRGIPYESHMVKHLVAGRSLKESTEILMAFYGIADDVEKSVNERVNVFQNILSRKVLFVDGFKEFFDKIPQYLQICIATSLRKDSLRVVDRKLGIYKLFQEKVFSIDDIGGKSKPDPAIFNYAARQLAVKPSKCLVIEDSPNGIKAAKKAGMKCIGLSTTFSKDTIADADFVCSTYKEIESKILEIL